MGQRIIKKQNGLFAVWTTVCDTFIMDDVTQEEVIEYLSEQAKEDTKRRLIMRFENNCHIGDDYEEKLEFRDHIHSKPPDKYNFFGGGEDDD